LPSAAISADSSTLLDSSLLMSLHEILIRKTYRIIKKCGLRRKPQTAFQSISYLYLAGN